MSWFDCAEGSTLVIRRTPGDGGKPLLSDERLTRSDGRKADVSLSTGNHRLFIESWPWGPPKPYEKFLRRDHLEVEGESIPVEVFKRITDLGGACAPICGRLVEEVWKRVDAPAAEGASRVRYDRVHSDIPPSCNPPPVPDTWESDAEGFVDTRRVLDIREEAVIDGWVYPCMRVRTWDHEGVPFDSLECPGVLGGKARWEELQPSRDGQPRRELLEVVSFDCRR